MNTNGNAEQANGQGNSFNKAPFEKGDRVKRKNQGGCHGTVVDVRTEVTKTNAEFDEKGLLVSVQWDNGTYSYFTPSALQEIA